MGIEFNGNVNNNIFVNSGIKPQTVSDKSKVEVNITDNRHLGEFGDKLLEQVQPRFVETAKISEKDSVQLQDMFELAGIKNPKMPTAAQYTSITNQVNDAIKSLDKLTTTTHTEDLFNSTEFSTLKDILGIA